MEERICIRLAELEKKVDALWEDKKDEYSKLLAIVDPQPEQVKLLKCIKCNSKPTIRYSNYCKSCYPSIERPSIDPKDKKE